MLIKEIYNKKVDGGRISDKELLEGLVFFKDLADKLVKCGPVFSLAFKEANNTYEVFYGYAVARNLSVPKEAHI